jgi:HK97 family phage portal protein
VTINPAFALHGVPLAEWGIADYSGLSREGYMRNPVVHRCVRMIAEASASMPWLLYDGAREMDTHPMLELLAAPNPRQSGQPFMEAVYVSLMVSGEAFIQRVDLDGSPRELHMLRADRVSKVTDDAGWPVAYDYAAGSTRQRFDAGPESPVLHVTLHNPLEDCAGFPPLASAMMALEIHNAASRWNKALLDNSARPSGALVYAAGDTKNLTDDQFDRLKSELEDGYSGPERAGRPLLLEGGLDWKPMGFSPKDMDFIEARNGAARDIALALGVPPMLLGIPGDNTYANYREANKAFWHLTILPLVTRMASSIGRWLSPAFGDGLRLDLDRDRIEALAPDRDALWKRVQEAGFLTENEKREAVGYGAIGDVRTD